jgi:hypothetical protein
VRQQEFLLAVDEVMMEVAYDLVREGFGFLGIAGDEFVVEQPRDTARGALDEVGAVAHRATRRILGDLGAPIALDLGEEW